MKKWLAFPNEGAMHGYHQPNQCLTEGSNEQSFDEEEKEEKQDLPIHKLMRDFYEGPMPQVGPREAKGPSEVARSSPRPQRNSSVRLAHATVRPFGRRGGSVLATLTAISVCTTGGIEADGPAKGPDRLRASGARASVIAILGFEASLLGNSSHARSGVPLVERRENRRSRVPVDKGARDSAVAEATAAKKDP